MKRLILATASAALLALGTAAPTLAADMPSADNGNQAAMPAPAPKAAQADDRTKQAQQALQTDGDYKGQIDGLWGPQTKQAVLMYQKKNGLKQTAQLDDQTFNRLAGTGNSGNAGQNGSGNANPAPTMPKQ